MKGEKLASVSAKTSKSVLLANTQAKLFLIPDISSINVGLNGGCLTQIYLFLWNYLVMIYDQMCYLVFVHHIFHLPSQLTTAFYLNFS